MSRFLRQNFVILVLMNSGNLFNYLFQMVVGRAMTPDEFGAFNALNSSTVIIAAPMGIVPLIMARFTAAFSLEGMGRVRGLFGAALKTACLCSVLAVFVGFWLAPLLRNFLHLDSLTPVYIMLAMLAVSLILPVPWGMLQGLQRFTGYGLAGASNAGMRLASSFVWVVGMGLGVYGGMLCGLTGMICQAALAFFFLRDLYPVQAEPLPRGFHGEVGRYSAALVVSSVVTMCLNNLDLVLVRHFCSELESGFYSTAAILGRIAFYGPNVLLSVLFANVAQEQASGEENLKGLWILLGITVALAGGYALCCAVGAKYVVAILFGAQYAASAPLLVVISLAMALLATANVFFVFFQARGEFGFMWVQGLGVALFAGLVSAYHTSAMQVAEMLLASLAFILAATSLWFLWWRVARRRRAGA
ncbi:oligosaccharide flippase family protein [Fundidesulfovibrio butyratiphilus]